MLVLGAIISFPVMLHVLVLSNQTSLALALMAAVYVAALSPMFAVAAKRHLAARSAGLILLGALLGLIIWQQDKIVLLYVPPVAINLWLMILFGTSLRRGSIPLISRIARLERGELTPELADYTRRLTWMWMLFFLGMAIESLLLALFAPLALWSWFANVWNYVFVATLFVGEYLYRRTRFAHYRHAPPWVLLRLMRGGAWQRIVNPRNDTP